MGLSKIESVIYMLVGWGVLASGLVGCGTMSMTRESPEILESGEVAFGAGAIYYESPWHGPKVANEVDPTNFFFGVRYGLNREVEVQISAGVVKAFEGTGSELRGRWQFYKTKKWLGTSSGYVFHDARFTSSDNETFQTYGAGVSGSAGYVHNKSLTSYFGAKFNYVRIDYKLKNAGARNASERFEGKSPGVFFGGSYKLLSSRGEFEDKSLDLDGMVHIMMLPKAVGNDDLDFYPGLTVALWY